MSSSNIDNEVGRALVDFTVGSTYSSEEAVISANVEGSALGIALELLNSSTASLKAEIEETSREVAPDVDSWITNAKSLQDDIELSRGLARQIIREAEADEHTDEIFKWQEDRVTFMKNEVAYNHQLSDALALIRDIHKLLDDAETLVQSGKILEALHLLTKAWDSLSKLPTSRTAQVVRILDTRCFDLRETANELLRVLWGKLVVIDKDEGRITINRSLEGEATDVNTALVSLKAYRQLENEAKQFWKHLDDLIMKPRLDLAKPLRSIHIEDNTIGLGDESVGSDIRSLFITIEAVIKFLVENLPADFVEPLSSAMMPELSTQLKDTWLDTAVPASLDEVVEFQKSLAQVQEFASNLRSLSWPGSHSFDEWVGDAAKIWISKKRETSLDWTRNQLSLGVGNPQNAQHFERRMVDRDEGNKIATTGNMVNPDWDAAWNSEEDEDDKEEEEEQTVGNSNRESQEEARKANEIASPKADSDGAAEAWGWGDEDVEEAIDDPMSTDVVEPPLTENIPAQRLAPETREITLSESYQTSSMPQPIYKTIAGIFNDGAKLTSPVFEAVPITPAAPALFSLPTLVLAAYRSVSPHYYTHHPSGNMFTYNDSIWLCDKLEEFQSEWVKRTDLSPRAFGKVKLEAEIKNLQGFGKRAYTKELNTQRTVIRDLLGGLQNFFQHDGAMKGDLDSDIAGVVNYIREVAASWKPILAYSAWASSVGALVNTVATKMINDIFELGDVSVDEAEQLAILISKVESLDDLFLPKADPKTTTPNSNGQKEEVPTTAQFADRWMKLKYLSEVLQSDLVTIRYFWFESHLSLYFTADEVLELIRLSFANNAAVKQLVREIKAQPHPLAEE